jgi:putative toxin-antitoxin system antitoxin component (TIGR02293 family)
MKTYKTTRKKYQIENTAPLAVAEISIDAFSVFNRKKSLSAIFGSNLSITNDFELIAATRKGINKKDLLNLSKALGLSQEELCKVLHMSTRTFHRLEDSATLDIYTTEQAIQMALIYEKSLEIFSSESAIQMWLKTPIRSLNMQTPLSLLDTGFGAKLVLDTLSAIEEGVFG